MPFGLTNAHGTFKHIIDIVPSSMKWKFAIVYLDDIIVFLKPNDEHMTHMKAVFTY